MTLNGRTTLYCTNNASFGVHHGNLKEDERILLAAKIWPMTLLLGGRLYKAHTDIRGG